MRLWRRTKRTLFRWFLGALRRVWPVAVLPAWMHAVLRVWKNRLTPHPGGVPPLAVVFDAKATCRVLADNENFDVKLYQQKMQQTFGWFLLGHGYDDEYKRQVALLRQMIEPDDVERMRKIARDAAKDAIEAQKRSGTNRIDVVLMVEQTMRQFVERYFGVPDVPAAKVNGNGKVDRHVNVLLGLCVRISSYVFNIDTFTGDLTEDASKAGTIVRDHLLEVLRTAPESSDTIVGRLVRAANQPSHPDVCTVLGGTLSGLLVPTSSQFLSVADLLLDLPARELDGLRASAAVRRDAARKGGSADDGRVARYVMEAARLYPFPIGLYRHCRDRTQVDTGSGRQRTIPADATVLALTIAADTDRRFAPHPGSFLVGRPERQSLVFGTGQHHCAGATEERPIAPTLMTEMATALFALPGVRRIGGRGTPSQQFKKGISVEYEGAPS